MREYLQRLQTKHSSMSLVFIGSHGDRCEFGFDGMISTKLNTGNVMLLLVVGLLSAHNGSLF